MKKLSIVALGVMSLLSTNLGAATKGFVEINERNVFFCHELSNSNPKLLFNPISSNFVVEQTSDTGESHTLIQRCDTDEVLRGVGTMELSFLLGTAWHFDYNDKVGTAYLEEDVLFSSLMSEDISLTASKEMMIAVLKAKPAGAYLKVIKIGKDFGLKLMPRLVGGGWFDTLWNWIVGNQIQEAVGTPGHISVPGIIVASAFTDNLHDAAVLAAGDNITESYFAHLAFSSSSYNSNESDRARERREAREERQIHYDFYP